ncbi:MAG: hypothetical protein ACE3JK_05350 [Sporolactobacillus sp.]
MSWNNSNYGGNYGCSNGGGCGGDYGRNDDRNRNRDKCDGRDLIRGISKNDFIKVFLKNSQSVEGFFAGISGNILTLFNCDHRDVSSISICLEDIVAIKSFGNSFNKDDRNDDRDHKRGDY